MNGYFRFENNQWREEPNIKRALCKFTIKLCSINCVVLALVIGLNLLFSARVESNYYWVGVLAWTIFLFISYFLDFSTSVSYWRKRRNGGSHYRQFWTSLYSILIIRMTGTLCQGIGTLFTGISLWRLGYINWLTSFVASYFFVWSILSFLQTLILLTMEFNLDHRSNDSPIPETSEENLEGVVYDTHQNLIGSHAEAQQEQYPQDDPPPFNPDFVEIS